MEPADAAAFGAEVARLRELGFALPPGVRAGWTLLRVFDGVLILVLTAGALAASALGMAVLPGVPMFGFVLGLGGGIVASAAIRRRLLTPLYRTLTRQLDASLGAVGGETSAAMPVLFTKPVAPQPPRFIQPVRPVRVGDPDAVDFDDQD